MIITKENIQTLDISDNDKKLLDALLNDLFEINEMIVNDLDREYIIEIHYQDWHNDYSPERTDPCPDYYGYYSLQERCTKEWIGDPMTLRELDGRLCTIINLLEIITGKYNIRNC